jgi:hypothetical protein
MYGEIAATILPKPNRPAPPLIGDGKNFSTLRSLTRAGQTEPGQTEQRLATRAGIMLAAAAGMPSNGIATDVDVCP